MAASCGSDVWSVVVSESSTGKFCDWENEATTDDDTCTIKKGMTATFFKPSEGALTAQLVFAMDVKTNEKDGQEHHLHQSFQAFDQNGNGLFATAEYVGPALIDNEYHHWPEDMAEYPAAYYGQIYKVCRLPAYGD
jgi:hypothetical protein